MCDLFTDPEKNERVKQWDHQIRLFAKYFLIHVRLPSAKFSLLDVGCGTGSSLHEIYKLYPYAELFGCDLEQEHIDISNKTNKKYATFFKSDIMEINNFYNIIYISNVIEHLHNWKEAVNHLLLRCQRIYILSPYKEILNFPSEMHTDGIDHVISFDKKTISFINSDEFNIESRIIRTPYAWGHPFKREVLLRFKAILKQEPFNIQRQILFSITNTKKTSDKLLCKPFFNRSKTIIRTLYQI
jgi:SAM-dependent methyltransferase